MEKNFEQKERPDRKNPVFEILKKQKPFIYFHTHAITPEVLDDAISSNKSLEVDISANPDNSLFIGHPLSYYDYKKQPQPNNLPLEEVLQKSQEHELYLVLDCKDVRALPKVTEIIKRFGSEKTLLHAFADNLLFKPYPPEITREPHWPQEDPSWQELEKVKQETGVPLVISSRGLTRVRLEIEGGAILPRIISAAKGRAEAFNFNLPGNEAPSKKTMQELLDHKILTWINIDRVLEDERPPVFLGTSDSLETASNPKDFQ